MLRAVTYRVLHVDTERGWRGGERQTLWLASELARRGHVCLVAGRRGEPLAERAAAAGLDVIECSPASEVDPRAAFRLRRVIRERKIDVVHAHTAHAVAVGALATLGTRIPMVVARRVDFPLRDNAGTRASAIAFNWERPQSPEDLHGRAIDLAVTLRKHVFMGNTEVEMRVVDVRTSGG